MTPHLTKALLAALLATPVGCVGVVVSYLILAVVGLNGVELASARIIYGAMELIGWYVVTPLGIAALVSGIVQSLATKWGLFRYYWIVAKLALTVFTIDVMVRTLDRASDTLAMTVMRADHLAELRPHFTTHASAGLAVLIAITALSIYKPWGATPFDGGNNRAKRNAITFPVLHFRVTISP